MSCISPQNATTPERLLSNPFYGKNFFDEGQYRVAVDRYEQGANAIDSLIKNLENFIKILERQSEKLRVWSKEVDQDIRSTSEHGTTKKALIGATAAMGLLAEPSESFAKALREKVLRDLFEFKSSTYGKSSHFLSTKNDFEKEFRKVQKLWISLLKDYEQNKEKLTEAKKKKDTAQRMEHLMTSDIARDENKFKQVQELLSKRKEKVLELEKIDEEFVKRIEKKKPEYVEQMTKILERILEIERKRLEKFNQVLESLKNLSDFKQYSNYQKIIQKFTEAIEEQNINSDLKHWNEHFGSETKFPWAKIPTDSS